MIRSVLLALLTLLLASATPLGGAQPTPLGDAQPTNQLAQNQLAQNKWVTRMDYMYETGQYNQLYDKAERWRKRNRKDQPASWVFTFYKAKASYRLATPGGVANHADMVRAVRLLESAQRRDREDVLEGLDPTFWADLKQTLQWEGEQWYAKMDAGRARFYFASLERVFGETSPFLVSLENSRNGRKGKAISTRDRADTTLVFPLEFLAYVNALRAKGCQCGDTYMEPAPPVKYDNTLAETAKLHSVDMVAQEYFSHTGKDGSKPWDRTKRLGYSSGMVGENISWGYYSEWAAFQGWKNSPGHCKNMMTPGFKFIGLGRCDTKWTMLLAR